MRFVVAVVLAGGLLWGLSPAASAEPLASSACFPLPPMCDPGFAPVCGCSGFSASTCVWSCVREK